MPQAIAIVVALFFAANIGASGSAAAMGEVYGSGAIRRKVLALVLVAIAVPLGAIFAGKEVTYTLSREFVPDHQFTITLALVALLSATIPLAVANIIGIPLSTSEVTVGAIVGVAAALGAYNVPLMAFIAMSWVLLPVMGFIIASIAVWLLRRFLGRDWRPDKSRGTVRAALVVLLITGGVYTAFSAGANNTANAIGPLVAAGVMDASSGLVIGGLVVGLGALLLGSRVLETNGKRITRLNLATGSIVSFTSATLVLVASLIGLPVPLTQVTSGAIMGVGLGTNGKRALNGQVVRDIGTIWVLSPVVAFLFAYFATTVATGLIVTHPNSLLLPVFLLTGFAVAAATLVFLNRPRLASAGALVRERSGQVRRFTSSVFNPGLERPEAVDKTPSRVEEEARAGASSRWK